jgi:hypothetical protein
MVPRWRLGDALIIELMSFDQGQRIRPQLGRPYPNIADERVAFSTSMRQWTADRPSRRALGSWTTKAAASIP